MNDRICLYVSPLRRINSYYQFIDLAAERGIKYIETVNQYELARPDIEEAKKIKNYADEKGVEIVCASLCVNLVSEGREENIKLAEKYADIAAILGSKYFHHTIACEFENPQSIKDNFELYYRQGLEAVREIYDYARTLGIRTVFEDQGFLFNGVENFGRFLNDVGRDVGVVADFGNIMFVDDTVERFIPAFSDRIVNIHVKDYIITDRENGEYMTYHGNYLKRCALKKGNVDFDAAFECIRAMGYKGTFSLECSVTEDDEEKLFAHNIAVLDGYISAL